MLKSTEFDGLHHVFEGAWQRIANVVNTAAQHGVGVLIGERRLQRGASVRSSDHID